MGNKLTKLKQVVSEACSSPNFKHHKWFLKYHLEIVEKISMELCDRYSEANRDLVQTASWLHDYDKILDFENQHENTIIADKELLIKLGFSEGFADKVIKCIKISDSKVGLDATEIDIEVKILSSADGAAHFFGPFFSLWWYENPLMDIQDIMKSEINKANIDWEKKIVLPEAKEVIKQRYAFILEQNGQLPKKYL